MKSQSTTCKSGALPRFLRASFNAVLLPAIVLLLSIQPSDAGSATWLASPATGDWNTASNWTAGGPPEGPADTATFATSNTTNVSLSANTEVNGAVFNAGASAFTITAYQAFQLTISGVGITNNSGITQNFVADPDISGNFPILFLNSATAGSATVFTANGGAVSDGFGGLIEFFGASTAGGATFINNGGAVYGGAGAEISFHNTSTAGNGTFTNKAGVVNASAGGDIVFYDTSTAGNGIFTNEGSSLSGANSGSILFVDASTAGTGTFINNGSTFSNYGGGFTQFVGTSTANSSTLVANGGSSGDGGAIYFSFDSTGGTARVELFGNGTGDNFTNGYLNLTYHNLPGLTVGSIEGNGFIILGSSNFTVGANNLSTTFSGIIGGGTGSLTKTGNGKLTLSGANTYTGVTTVSKGTLLVASRTGSATGSGAVAVNAGTLGGTGKISGAVTIGTATSAAILAPGSGARPGKLTLLKTLTFNARANYKVDLNSTLVTADQVVAKGVTINSGAIITIGDLGAGILTAGTVFTVINNTVATPIAGTFSNLADGSTLIVGSNTYKANYEGGTGNDLTLTVQ